MPVPPDHMTYDDGDVGRENQDRWLESLGRLADVVTTWIENDPLYTSRYTAKKKSLAEKMLGYADDIAALSKPAPDVVLYRGYDVKKSQVQNDGSLLIQPRACDLLESWTTDASWAFEHAEQFESGVVIRKVVGELDVFLDTAALSEVLGETIGNEGEVLVRPVALSVPKGEWTWSENEFPDLLDAAPHP